MSLRDRLRQSVTSTLGRNLYGLYFVPWMTATARWSPGRNLFDEEWDLAIILDACRVDALRAVADEYDYIDEVDSVLSVGSSSKEWMVNTFRKEYAEEISQTAYLTGNAWADVVLQEDVPFSKWTVTNGSIFESNNVVERLLYRPTVTRDDFDEVFMQSLTEMNGIEAFCPEELTNYAIHTGRKGSSNRVLVHYMQPHAPYIHNVTKGNEPSDFDQNPMECLRSGYERGPIWDAYLDNLRCVLDEVQRLLENFDGNAIITSDHGELFGEIGLYGHAEGIPHPKLKRVPWIRAKGIDQGSIEVNELVERNAKQEVDERLSALGYL